MGFIAKPFFLFSFTLFLLAGFEFLPSVKTASDITTFVYKGCASQSFSDPSYLQSLSALFASLTAQASKEAFFKTSTGGGQVTISGLFQCRGDLSNNDCYSCVGKLPDMANQLCGSAVAARVQLYGCYLLYEVSGFPAVSGVEMLYKTCSASEAAGVGFEERRDTALTVLESGVASNNGFYMTSYQSVYMLAQCEGDLGSSDCEKCVQTAVQKAQVECGSSISGQVYLQMCFISYSYQPNGVSRKSSSGVGQNTGKTIAIVVGGAAALGFLVICLTFVRSLMKKHDDY
ncbi:plasmodesmata-located protein 2-like isoform X2 [Telopea speciosissima]|uniref:plasmodesmata-located protein 2-like isoform X2 n=1 Tax=Telopea speciosissima TaxID=54955 RepID=UPI001CC7205E|nr:plasmodesmata-located protein 2-like isoform X2 [Telopea speciosissima]